MPVIQPTTREIRYEQRCSKKTIENQKDQRTYRYEKRCALREEAKTCVSVELNERVQKKQRTSTRKPTTFGFFGNYF